MNKIKNRILKWLLKDEKIRRVALREIIGDAEVKHLDVKDCKDLTISDCYIFQSKFNDCEGITIEGNVMDYCSITGNTFSAK